MSSPKTPPAWFYSLCLFLKVEVHQGKEPPCFLQLFHGSLVIHKGQRDGASTIAGTVYSVCLLGHFLFYSSFLSLILHLLQKSSKVVGGCSVYEGSSRRRARCWKWIAVVQVYGPEALLSCSIASRGCCTSGPAVKLTVAARKLPRGQWSVWLKCKFHIVLYSGMV